MNALNHDYPKQEISEKPEDFSLLSDVERRVYGVCLKMTKNAAEAEDLTQDVFVKLYHKIGSFRGESAFSTWLHRTTVNTVLMHFRKQKTIKEQTTEDGEFSEHILRKAELGAAQPLSRIEMTQAIAGLPNGYRKVFILHDIQGFDHEEIGQILGCAVGTSKSQLHKARRKMRRLLSAKTDFNGRDLLPAG